MPDFREPGPHHMPGCHQPIGHVGPCRPAYCSVCGLPRADCKALDPAYVRPALEGQR